MGQPITLAPSPRKAFRAGAGTLGGVLLVLIAGCSQVGKAPDASAGKLQVFVSVAPQAYFVERVGGTHVAVGVLAPPGDCGHSYEPTPQQVAQLTQASVYFRTGLEFEEPFLAKLRGTHPQLAIVDLRQGVHLRILTEAEDPHEKAEGGHGNEAHGEGPEPDPHIWMAPQLAKVQARTICTELVRLAPQHQAEFAQNLKAFEADLDRLDGQLAQALAPVKGRKLLVFHGLFGYFADAYGLRQEAVESFNQEPTAKQLARLIEDAKKDGVKVIFVQPQFPPQQARVVAAEIGGVVVSVDPLGRDYLRNMEEMAERIAAGLK